MCEWRFPRSNYPDSALGANKRRAVSWFFRVQRFSGYFLPFGKCMWKLSSVSTRTSDTA